jgi:hypothetical protein
VILLLKFLRILRQRMNKMLESYDSKASTVSSAAGKGSNLCGLQHILKSSSVDVIIMKLCAVILNI